MGGDVRWSVGWGVSGVGDPAQLTELRRVGAPLLKVGVAHADLAVDWHLAVVERAVGDTLQVVAVAAGLVAGEDDAASWRNGTVT